MVKKDIIDAYKTIDLKTYIDTTVKAPDLSLLKTELNKHERFLQGINQDIYKTFLLNTDTLVSMLERTNNISQQMEDTEKLIEEYSIIFSKFREEEEPFFVDEQKQKRFWELLSKFDESAHIFKTNKRYLVHSQDFGLIDNGHCRDSLLLFTNDILIIGEKNKENYVLKNAFNYNVLKVQDKDTKLKIVVAPFEFVFEGEEKYVKRAIRVFKEVMYKNKIEPQKKQLEQDNNSEYVNFLLQTENYRRLSQMKDVSIKTVDISMVRGGINNFLLVLKFVKEKDARERLFLSYLSNVFDNKMASIDISRNLKSIIDDFFNNFYDSYDKSVYFIQKYGEKFTFAVVFKARFILLLRNKIENIFKLLKRRIFGKYSNIDKSEEYIEQIRGYLKFDGYDFTFLTDYFKTEKEEKTDKLIEESKMQIKNLIDEMIGQDYVQ